MPESPPASQNVSLSSSDWSDAELTCAILAYLAMLRKELAGIAYSKAEVNRTLREGELAARTKGAIEFRMQNISATLYDLRMPRIAGYLPARNVGTSVKGRITSMLDTLDIADLRNFVPTADAAELEAKVRVLRSGPIAAVPPGAMRPTVTSVTQQRFVRDPAVKAWVLRQAEGICEACAMPAPFVGDDAQPYLEVHHVMPLACLGSDRVSNTVALCPNCHRRCHSSNDREEFKLSLYERIQRLQIEVPEENPMGLNEFIESKGI